MASSVNAEPSAKASTQRRITQEDNREGSRTILEVSSAHGSMSVDRVGDKIKDFYSHWWIIMVTAGNVLSF